MSDNALPPTGTWTEREMTRFVFREALFRKRGESPSEAEKLAERLVQRDRDGDDRRYCIECAHIRSAWACTQGGPSIREVPHRCERFAWMKPT